jgi:hypothetical protein
MSRARPAVEVRWEAWRRESRRRHSRPVARRAVVAVAANSNARRVVVAVLRGLAVAAVAPGAAVDAADGIRERG